MKGVGKYLGYVRSHAAAAFAAFLAAFLSAAAMVGFSYAVRWAIEGKLSPPAAVGLLSAIALALLLLDRLRVSVVTRTATKIQSQMLGDYLAKVYQLDLSRHSKLNPGAVLQRITDAISVEAFHQVATFPQADRLIDRPVVHRALDGCL